MQRIELLGASWVRWQIAVRRYGARILVDIAAREAYEVDHCHPETEIVCQGLVLGRNGFGDQQWRPITKRVTISRTSQIL